MLTTIVFQGVCSAQVDPPPETLRLGFSAKKMFCQKNAKILQTFSQSFAFFCNNKWSENESKISLKCEMQKFCKNAKTFSRNAKILWKPWVL